MAVESTTETKTESVSFHSFHFAPPVTKTFFRGKYCFSILQMGRETYDLKERRTLYFKIVKFIPVMASICIC